MKKMTIDAAFTPTSRTRTPEGYLCVKGVAARTGVYQYVSTELDLPGPARIVNVYKPAEELFSAESMATAIDKDVTNDHPDDLVDSTTFRTVSVGHARGYEQDGDNAVVDMIIKDQSAIDDIESGKAELSPGYTAEYVPEAGVAPDGQSYEYVQRIIKYNHFAVVDAARAGKVARIFDHKPKGIPHMATRKVFLDSKKSRSIVLDEDAASVVEEAVSALEDMAEEAEKRADEAQAKADELEDKLESAVKATSDAAIGDRVKLTLDTIAKASKIVKNFDAKGVVSPLEIKRAALTLLKPTRDWAGKSEAYITAAFDSAEEDAKETEDEDDDEAKSTKDSLSGLAKDLQNRPKLTNDGSEAYSNFLNGVTK